CPANLTIECDESTDPSNTGTATATDNCDSTPIITYSDSRSGGVITRTWTATDACGNSATCQQVITIDDTTTPVISCPGNITIECDESTDPANTGSATATDNCDSSPVITYADSETAGSCPQEKTITRTWTATDENNNSSQCQQIITVSDNTSPTISCPDDYIIECYGSSDPSITGYATAADNCDTAPTVTYSDAVVGDIITRTWTATDACGNNSQCIQHITFAENNPPIATCPGDAEIFVCELDEICLPGFSCSDPDDNLASCEAIGGTLNAGMICFTPVPGVNQLTLIATDDCGLADSCVTNITVTVNTPPVAGCPDDQEISVCSLEEICISGFSCSDVDDNLATCSVNKGTLNGNTVCFVPTAGNNTIRLIATDSCGAADTSSVTINVTLNNPPEVTCPGLTTVKLTEFPAEVCVSGFAFSDPDGNLAGYEVEGGVLSGNEVCFTASDEGIYAITLTATDDCGAEAYCVTDVFVKRLTVCPIVKIEKTHNTHQGQYENVSITVENSSYPIGGFDFLIAYDNSALTAAGAYAGQWLEDCDWEYFTYRFGSNGNCGDACPSGLLRIIAMAESNDGGNHPDCYGPPDADVYELARIQFLVTNDLNMNCQYVPIYFFWDNCGDNTFSSQEGDYLYIDNRIYNFEGGLIWDEEDETNYPESSRIPFVGAPDNCLNPDPEKPSAIRCIEFVYGGIDIICRDSIDAPGDVNLNGIPNEIGDAIVFTNYFIFSLSAFTINVDGQSAATDVNYDGAMLTVADLVYLIRTIVGDNSPVPKIAPDINAEFVSSGSVITVNRDLGAVHLVLEGRAEIQPGHDAAHMDIISSYDGINTNVLIYSFEKGFTCSGEILQTEAGIVSAEAADYHGNQYAVKIIPNNFALTCYPNPFNPITMIELNLPSSSEWKIEVYNVTGQRVANFEGSSEAGKVRVEWDASDFASGIYLYKAEAGNYRMTRKMALIK
nr:T9SS type A sorting domain-containing protein [candidate division Zixibacteria bacterium]